ncbi:MAG: hypothetical protein AAB414_04550 [Patescibacteria group bacterium]|mgnify:FL=1
MPEITRREVLKAILPFGWISEVRRAGGLGRLSTSAKISIIKDIAIFIPSVSKFLLEKRAEEKPFRDKVSSFTWEQAKGIELERFTEEVADEYLRLTKTTRIRKNDLIGRSKVNFYQNRDEMVKAIREVNPGFSPTLNQWGFTDYSSRKVFIDLGTLKEQVISQARSQDIDPSKTAGIAMLDALWHEWGHLDVTERSEGKLINNPQFYFHSPNSDRNEQFKRYRGAEVFTDTYFGFSRFEEVLVETIAVKRMIEQVGLKEVFSAADYYPNGVDFFPSFTSAVGISLDQLYQMHATSDFEGLVNIIGQKLPSNEDSLEKGSRLLVGIHRSDPQLITQTNALNLIPQRRKS